MSKVRFAILGTAKIARTLAPRIHASARVELVGIASRNSESAEAFAREFNIPQTYDSYQAALDDPQIDAVYMPLPPSLHQEWTEKAAAAGKHVLSEKPLARNVTEVDRMINVCRNAGVVLLDGVMWYHTSRCTAIKDVIHSGELGELRQITSVFTFRWDSLPMDNLRLHRDLGGGSLLDLGWYCVGGTLLLYDDLPVKVQAFALWENDVDVRMNAFLWFSNDRMATIECGFDTVRRRWMEVAGAKAALVCDDFTRPWNPDKPRFWIHNNDGQADQRITPHPPQEECMVDAFCDLIASQQINHPLLQLARNTQLVCDALDRSAREGQSISL
ncbi:MAG: Gfo/Idh/MocA family oxidoreductase [Fuerstiella sp.]